MSGRTRLPFFLIIITFILLFTPPRHFTLAASAGRWQLLQKSIGVSAMHMQLLHNDNLIIFDRTDFGPSNISLPDSKCREDQNDLALKVDCTAHSVQYDVASNTFRPLTILSDTWCSSGAVSPDGRLIQTGGYNDGERRARIFTPCQGVTCDWQEIQDALAVRRWYATNHILPDGRQILIGGRRQFNYEYYPKNAAANTYSLPFLVQTNDRGVENNLYPFVFLNTDGNIFIFANDRAILLDYVKNKVVRNYPEIPGTDPRCYPSSGSAVLLPLKNIGASVVEAEVLVCGGTPKGAYLQAAKGKFLGALNTCARIKITDPNPKWVIETMPHARVMGDMTLLPNGNVLIVNGAASGAAGWEYGRDPVLSPELYRPDNPLGSRFETQNPTTIPRMYHSSAVLVRDGRVVVGGSNPHIFYNFTGVMYPTELSLEAFSPSYLDARYANVRPKIYSPKTQSKISYGKVLTVRIVVAAQLVQKALSVTLVSPPFTTHAFSMNQRLLMLGVKKIATLGKSVYDVSVTAPASGNLAPAGFYLLFAVHQDIPSEGIWVQLQ